MILRPQPDQLIALCANGNESGVTTTTIGFGEGYDEHLLKAMSDAGGGSTYYIESPDEAGSVFAHEIVNARPWREVKKRMKKA